jgi:hypothetical protein
MFVQQSRYKVKVIHDACATLDQEFNGIKVLLVMSMQH